MITSFSNRSARAMMSSRVGGGRTYGSVKVGPPATNGHLENHDLRLVQVGETASGHRAVYRPDRATFGHSDLGRNLDTRQPEVANLLTAEVVILGLELLPLFVDEVADGRDRMLGGEGFHHQPATELDFLTRDNPDELGGQTSAIELLERGGTISTASMASAGR